MRSCDESLVTLAFLWKKLSPPQFYKNLTRKTAFFEGWSWSKFNNLVLALGTNLKFYAGVAKGLKLSQRVLEANVYICRSYRGKTGRRNIIMNRVKILNYRSRDMLKFGFLDKGLGTISPAHFVYDFSTKMFLMLYSINWSNFIVWLPFCL